MKRSYSFQIISRILLIIFLSIGLGWTWCNFSGQNIIYLALLLTILLIIAIIRLFRYLNTVNQHITYFFDAMLNEDFSTINTLHKKNKLFKHLEQKLDQVNEKVQHIKLESVKQEHYFRALIEHVGIGILTFDDNEFVIHANGSLKRLLGTEQFTHLKQLKRFDQKLYGILTQIKPQEHKIITITNKKQKQLNLLIKANAFKSRDQQYTLLSLQDIDQELDEKELDSWLKLIRVLIHEIMNAITPITSLSDSLAQYFIQDGEAITAQNISDKTIKNTVRGLEIIKEQGIGLTNFVESYRKLTRLPKPEKHPIDVHTFLEKTVMLCKAGNSDSPISIEVECDENITILADHKQITQVLLNLLKNAQQALEDTQEAKIVLRATVNEKGQTEIAIRDNGPGIPDDLMEEIFVPFFTTRESGSGIGLSLSRQIMRLHGGHLKAQSIPFTETIFTMTFN